MNDLKLIALQSIKSREKFFYHLSILSGATLTLLIPFISNIKHPVYHVILLKISVICLLVSLILSSLRNFYFAKNQMNIIDYKASPDEKNVLILLLKCRIEIMEYIVILSFISSLIVLYFFIFPNII